MLRGWLGKKLYAKKSLILAAKPEQKIIALAQAELGVRELTACNDGPRVEAYLRCVGLHRGDPYCAAFISWIFMRAGYPEPRTGWSPALFPARLLAKVAAPGNVYGIYFPTLRRVAHCGLVERVKGNWITGIEANTNLNGSRNGDGVYRRLRPVKTVHCFADWINGSSGVKKKHEMKR